MRIAEAKTVTLTEMPALAAGESWRSGGRRERGMSVGVSGASVSVGWEGRCVPVGLAVFDGGGAGVELELGAGEPGLEVEGEVDAGESEEKNGDDADACVDEP